MDILERFLYGDTKDEDDTAGLDKIWSELKLNKVREEEINEEVVAVEDAVVEDAVVEEEVTTKEEFDEVPHSHKLKVAKDIIKRKNNFTKEMFAHRPRLFRTANKSLKLSRLGTKKRLKRKAKDDNGKS